MDMTHLNGFLEAMQKGDLDALEAHMADDVIVRSPIVVEPFRGKAAVRSVAQLLLKVVDKFTVRDVMQGSSYVAVYLGLTVGSDELDGVDCFRMNDSGLVQEMAIMWRPLPAVVAVQNRLAPAIGAPALQLVPIAA